MARAHLPRAAQGAGRAGRPPRGRDHAAGTERARKIRPKQKLHVAVPDRRGRRASHCAVRLQAGQESQERGGIPGGLLRVSPRGRYQGYHKLRPDIRVVGCWAHARRKFDEAVKSLPQKEQAAAPPWRARLSAPNCSPLKKTSKAFPLKRSANSGRTELSRCWTLCSHGRKKNGK
mgnify:CR=1 FL=1